jgi:hypothetical protein
MIPIGGPSDRAVGTITLGHARGDEKLRRESQRDALEYFAGANERATPKTLAAGLFNSLPGAGVVRRRGYTQRDFVTRESS